MTLQTDGRTWGITISPLFLRKARGYVDRVLFIVRDASSLYD